MTHARGLGATLFMLLVATPLGATWAEEAPAPSAEGLAAEAAEDGGTEDGGAEGAAEREGQEPDPAALAIAQERFRFGMQLVRSENWRAALVEFDASIAALPNRSALYNRAVCLRQLYEYEAAVEAFLSYLEYVGDDVEAAQRAEITGYIEAMEEMLTPVTIRVERPGAMIFVNDEEVGRSPLDSPLRLLAGNHTLRASLAGYVTARREIRVITGRPFEVALELAEEARQGVVRVESNVEGAEVWVDGEEAGLAGHPLLLEEGDHRLEVRAEGYEAAARTLLVEADREQLVEIALERPFRFPRALFWSVVGLTAAGALTTAALGIATAVLDGRYDPWSADAVAEHRQGEQLAVGADAALAVSVTAAALSLVIGLFTDWQRRPRAAVGLDLSIAP